MSKTNLRTLSSFSTQQEKCIRIFIKKLEKNMNSMMNVDHNIDYNRSTIGYALQIESISGLSINKKDKLKEGETYNVRFIMTVYNRKRKEFIGNTFRSPITKIDVDDTSLIINLAEEIFTTYFLCPESNDLILFVQIILVKKEAGDAIMSQSCKGWVMIDLSSAKDNIGSASTIEEEILKGSPRDVLFNELKKIKHMSNKKFSYKIGKYPDLEIAKDFLPDCILLSHLDYFPGIMPNNLPKIPQQTGHDIKLTYTDELFLENIKVIIDVNLEDDILKTIRKYLDEKAESEGRKIINESSKKKKKKKESETENEEEIETNGDYKIKIKERRLKVGFHNTWSFINHNGIENGVSLSKENNYLECKGRLQVNPFYIDEIGPSALILELNYTILIIEGPKSEESTLYLPIGYSIFVPSSSNISNETHKAYFITGPGITIYGEHLFIAPSATERAIVAEFTISQRKPSSDEDGKLRAAYQIQQSSNVSDARIKDYENQLKKQNDSLKAIKQKGQQKEMENQQLKKKIQLLEDERRKYLSQATLQPKSVSPQVSIQGPQISFQPPVAPPPPNIPLPLSGTFPQGNQTISSIPGSYNPSPNMGYMAPINYNPNYEQPIAPQIIYQTQQLPSAGVAIDPEYEEYLKYKSQQGLYQNPYEQSMLVDDRLKGSKISYDVYQESLKKMEHDQKVQIGISSFDIEDINPNILDSVLGFELSSKLGQKILIQFLAYKPLLFNNYDGNERDKIPKVLRFDFNFWTNQNLSSDVCRVSIPEGNIKLSNRPLELIKENSAVIDPDMQKRVVTEILFDPSVERGVDFRDYMSYLYRRMLIVEVIDIEKHIKIGILKIPLKDLIRGGKKQVISTKEYEIYDSDLDVKGFIQILLQNTVSDTKYSYTYNRDDLKTISCLSGENQSNKNNKKRTIRAIDTNQLSSEQKEKIGQMMIMQNSNLRGASFKENNLKDIKKFNINPEMEKRLRVMRFLGTNLQDNKLQLEEERMRAIKNKKEENEKFYKQLDYINQLKKIGKESVLSKVALNSNKTDYKVSLILGQPFYFNYMVKNDSESKEILHFVICDSASTEEEHPVNPNDKTVSIISQPEEWARVVDTFKLATPSDYHIMGADNYLNIYGGETVPVTIKLVLYRQLLREKTYTIWVYKNNKQPLCFLSITIEKCFPIIDHIFNYYEPCQSTNILSIINPYKRSSSVTATLLKNSLITDYSVNLEVDEETKDFKFRYTTKENGFIHEFYIFFYKQSQRYLLHMTWKFVIYSVNYINITVNLGTKKHDKLVIVNNLPDGEAKSLKLYSSDNRLVFFGGEEGESSFTVLAQQTVEKDITVFPKSYRNTRCLVNCVDNTSGELFMSWLIKINPQKPIIDEICKVECRAGALTNFNYKFTNDSNAYSVITFESENEDFIRIVDAKVMFLAKETKVINMTAPSTYFYNTKEVLVFVYDEEEIFSKTILFQLSYK
ncbi:MAG: hypothetical protein MJ252_07410 [archaeon]|nr:hypothetical protein [archaeon]